MPWPHITRLATAAVLLTAVTGCVNIQVDRDLPRFEGKVAKPLLGSVLETRIAYADRVEIARAVDAQVLNPAMRPEPLTWRNRGTGSFGTVSVGAPFVLGVDSFSGTPPEAPLSLSTEFRLMPDPGDFRTRRRANLRAGPSTRHSVLATLDEGTLVESLGRVEGRDWRLVGRRDQVLGYIYAPLLEARIGNEPGLAGGKARPPVLCREVTQSVTLGRGLGDDWTVHACRRPDGRFEMIENLFDFAS